MQLVINVPDENLPYLSAFVDDRISTERQAASNMTLMEFQKLLAPHTLIALWAWPENPGLLLWGGEIETCDFSLYGNREVAAVKLYNRDYFRGFLVYLRPAVQRGNEYAETD